MPGTYSYPAAGQAQPHAVASITGTVNGVVNPNYTYDANGNMLSGDGRAIAPTSFNMASEIDQGTVSECFTYDAEHARIEMDAKASGCTGSLSSSTVYLNDPASGATSEAFVSGATTTWRDYVASDDGLVAIRFCTGASPCTTGATADYVVSDQIGSTSVLTDGSGNVLERDSYDAWGLRRNPNGSDASSCNSITSATTRGFTRQEHIDALCLINYNARFYDPAIGRFMAADPVTATPYDLQVLNKYSYVLNSPTDKTDPTGNDASGSGGAGNTCSLVGASDCSGSYNGDGTTAQRIGADGELGGIRRTGEVLAHLASRTTNPAVNSDASPKDTNGAATGALGNKAQYLRTAVVDAFKMVDPKFHADSDIQPLTKDYAAVKDIAKLPRGWFSATSPHAEGGAREWHIPGVPDEDVKLYINDSTNGHRDTVTLTPYTYSFRHVEEFFTGYLFGNPGNYQHAQQFCQESGKC